MTINHKKVLDLIDEMMFGFEPTKPYVEVRRLIIADRDADSDDALPPIKPIDGKPNKPKRAGRAGRKRGSRDIPMPERQKMALSLSCDRCDAPPGLPCTVIHGNANVSKGERVKHFHPERTGGNKSYVPNVSAEELT